MVAPGATKLSEVMQPAHRHLAAGEIEAAKALLQQGLQQWPRAGPLRMLAARIAEAEGRHNDAIPIFREAAVALRAEIERSPENPGLALALAQALTKCGEAEAAAAALTLARQRGVDPADALRTERALAWSRKDWPWLRRVSEELIRIQANPAVQDFVTLAAACRNLEDLDGAAEAAARALERNPAQIDAAIVAAWVAVRRGHAETAISCYRRLAEMAPDNPRWPFETIRLLILSGSVTMGSSELAAALARWPNDPSLRAFALICGFRSPEEIVPVTPTGGGFDIGALREQQLRRVVDRAPKNSELRRPIVVDDKASDVIVARAANVDTAVLVFTALTDVVSMPLPIFDRYLAALGITAIYLKDFQRLFYLRGIASLGQRYDGTIRALREICRRLGLQRLFTLGTSAGGFAAVRYGVELGADRMLSFCGETHGAVGGTAKLEPGVALIKRRLAACVPQEELDLREFLLSRRYSGKIEWFYSAGAARDTDQALHLSGIGGLTLQGVTGCDDHELLRWLALHDDLSAILARAFALSLSE
jgi:tetratricopeptide (TPR) repeat protein